MNKDILKIVQLCPARKDGETEENRHRPLGSRKESTAPGPVLGEAGLSISSSPSLNHGEGYHSGPGAQAWAQISAQPSESTTRLTCPVSSFISSQISVPGITQMLPVLQDRTNVTRFA